MAGEILMFEGCFLPVVVFLIPFPCISGGENWEDRYYACGLEKAGRFW
jgi:hypothetical protein